MNFFEKNSFTPKFYRQSRDLWTAWPEIFECLSGPRFRKSFWSWWFKVFPVFSPGPADQNMIPTEPDQFWTVDPYGKLNTNCAMTTSGNSNLTVIKMMYLKTCCVLVSCWDHVLKCQNWKIKIRLNFRVWCEQFLLRRFFSLDLDFQLTRREIISRVRLLD